MSPRTFYVMSTEFHDAPAIRVSEAFIRAGSTAPSPPRLYWGSPAPTGAATARGQERTAGEPSQRPCQPTSDPLRFRRITNARGNTTPTPRKQLFLTPTATNPRDHSAARRPATTAVTVYLSALHFAGIFIWPAK